MSAPTTGSPNMDVTVASKEMALLSNLLAAYTFIAGMSNLTTQCKNYIIDFLSQFPTSLQTNLRGQRWCSWAASALASSSHSAPSSFRYTVELTVTTATATSPTGATGGSTTTTTIITTVPTAPTIGRPSRATRRARLWLPTWGRGLVGTANQRSGTKRRTCQRGGGGASRELF